MYFKATLQVHTNKNLKNLKKFSNLFLTNKLLINQIFKMFSKQMPYLDALEKDPPNI